MRPGEFDARSSHWSVRVEPAGVAADRAACRAGRAGRRRVGVVAVGCVAGHGGQVDLDGEVETDVGGQVVEFVVDRQRRLAGGELDVFLSRIA